MRLNSCQYFPFCMLDGQGELRHTFASAVELDGDALVHVLLEIQDVLLLWSLCWRPPLRAASTTVTAPAMPTTTTTTAAASSVPAAAASPAAVASAAASASVGHDLVGWSWVARGVCR